jgi:hypothetical protein
VGQRPKLLSFSEPSEARIHPFLRPVGFRKDGRPIYPIMGGSGEDDDDDEDDSTSGATVPIGRYLKMRERMRAADRRASTAEARVKELEPAATELEGLKKQVAKQTETIKSLRLDNAFLTSDIEWVDPDAALRLADLSEVEITEDGKVKGLEDALKALAEKKPYLVKKKDEEKGGKGKAKKDGDEGSEEEDEESDDEATDDDEDEEEEESASGTVPPPLKSVQGGVSGTSTGSGKRKRHSKGPTDEELMRRYRI